MAKRKYDFVSNILIAAGTYPSKNGPAATAVKRMLRKFAREAVTASADAISEGHQSCDVAKRIAQELVP